MPFSCGRISVCSEFPAFRGLFLLYILSPSEGTSHHLQPRPSGATALSPPLGADPFPTISLLYREPREKYILGCTLLNYHIARMGALGSQELTRSICIGCWDFGTRSTHCYKGKRQILWQILQGMRGNSPQLLESPQGRAVAENGVDVPGIFYYLLILFTSFCFTIKQISALMNIKMLLPHKR